MCAVSGDGWHVTEMRLARFESSNSVRVDIVSIGTKLCKIMGFKFCNTLKPHVGQIQDGRHPNNKISMFRIPVLKLDFCAYCKVFNGKDRVS